MKCRFCKEELTQLFVSLGKSPLSNAFLNEEQLDKKEPLYPLDVYVCGHCYLVQLPDFEKPENIFTDYAYFSSYSDTWLKHAEDYVDKVTKLFGIGKTSHVVEIASNDGYLLQYFRQKGVPVLGIEPARNVAIVAQNKGIETHVAFFGSETARRLSAEGRTADLLLGNNVLAHVPDLNDFVEGLRILLKPGGVITMEFPHLLRLMEENQFDTIYHEHFSYFSFLTVEKIFLAHELIIFHVEELSTHGGSLRIYAMHQDNIARKKSLSVSHLAQKEISAGLARLDPYLHFKEKVVQARLDILDFFAMAKKDKKVVVGYGAPAKGNTLLNYCGLRSDFIEYTVDRSPHKQGRYLPGTHIFVDKPDRIRETKPDYVFILPWNIKEEIMQQMSFVRGWGGKFVVPIPSVMVI